MSEGMRVGAVESEEWDGNACDIRPGDTEGVAGDDATEGSVGGWRRDKLLAGEDDAIGGQKNCAGRVDRGQPRDGVGGIDKANGGEQIARVEGGMQPERVGPFQREARDAQVRSKGNG